MDVPWRTRWLARSRVNVLQATAFRHVVLAALALLLITSLPYLHGYLSTPVDKVFSGIVYNVHDTAQYLSWMRESGSRVFIDNRLTSEANPAIFFNLHWWIPGRLAAMTGASLIGMYHLMRIVSLPLLVAAMVWLCSLFVADARRRLYTFSVAVLGSGLGWVWVAEKYVRHLDDVRFPTDVYTAPGNAFYTMLVSPHLTLAAALLMFSLGLAYAGYTQNKMRHSVAAGLVALALGQGHVYDLVTVWGVLGLFGLVVTLRDGLSRRAVLHLGMVVALSAPAAGYWASVASSANPVWQQALNQYDNLGVFTPDPLHLVILLGLRLIVALATFSGFVPLAPSAVPGAGSAAEDGGLSAVRNHQNRALFVKVWAIAGLIMIYLPLKFRIMLLLGLELPLSILAVEGVLDRIVPWLRDRGSKLWARLRITPERLTAWSAALFLLAVLPTNLYIFGWRLVDLNRHDYPFYLYRDDAAAIEWLDTHTAESDVVLGSFVIGHYVPGLAGNRTFLSNAVMTANFNQKFEDVQHFFDSSTQDAWRDDLMNRYGIRYVIYGEAEKQIGGFDPGQSPLFAEVFASKRTRVFAVRYSGSP
ncbi:MAG: hypothetical protein ACRDGG_08930 [Anaerolineae bacterium]